MASDQDRAKAANPNLGSAVKVNIGTTAAAGKAAGDAANSANKKALNDAFNRPLPRPRGA